MGDKTHIDFSHSNPPRDLPAALQAAAELAARLEASGVGVHSAFDNGRCMVLLIDSEPKGVTACTKRRWPNGSGTTSLYSASHGGCQLEWVVETRRETTEVANG